MRLVLGVVAGAALGFAWYRLSGGSCPTNACPLSSSPWFSTLWGALMGALVVGR